VAVSVARVEGGDGPAALPRLPHGILPTDRPARVVVFRALALGDLLCAVPALRALRRTLPDAQVSLIALPWTVELTRRLPGYVDELIEFPGFPGLPEVEPVDPGRLAAFLVDMQRREFDLAVQLQGDGLVSNGLTCLLGARWALGVMVPERAEACPGTWLPFDPHLSEVRRHLRVVAALGGPASDPRLEFPLLDSDADELTAALNGAPLPPGSYAVVHPGAAAPLRRWPADRFAAVADDLVRNGTPVVLTGSSAEREIVTGVRAAMAERALDLSGRTTLGALAALVAGSRLVVVNDTGVSHLAVALGVPSVTVSTATDPVRWAPPPDGRHVFVGGVPEANGCAHAPDAPDRCLGEGCTLATRQSGVQPSVDVTVDEVLAAIESLFGTGRLVA
jgi:ADP-heptose:LPS heptosyltransferase